MKRPAIYELLERYSSWNVLKGKIVWLTRFKNLLSGRTLNGGKPTIPELEQATNDIVKMTQRQVYSEEYNDLNKKKNVKVTSSIAKLNSFVDGDSVIRVGSRLELAPLSYDAKFPPVLPKHHWVSQLLARHIHCDNGHIGQEHTLNLLRERFWICKARSLVRKIINKSLCVEKAKLHNSINKWLLPLNVESLRTNPLLPT